MSHEKKNEVVTRANDTHRVYICSKILELYKLTGLHNYQLELNDPFLYVTTLTRSHDSSWCSLRIALLHEARC